MLGVLQATISPGLSYRAGVGVLLPDGVAVCSRITDSIPQPRFASGYLSLQPAMCRLPPAFLLVCTCSPGGGQRAPHLRRVQLTAGALGGFEMSG